MDRTQQVILGVAGLIVFYQTFRGWRMGLVRQIIRFGAIVAAYVAGFYGSPSVVPLLRPLHLPDFLLHAFAGMVLGGLVYLIINLFGGLLFKKTADQNPGLLWFFYGVTGALLGMAFGLVLVAAVAITIRFAGTMVEGAASRGSTQPNPFASTVLVVKHSLDIGVPAEFLQALDPVPKGYYQTIGKIGELASQPDAIRRFAEYPGAKELVQNPEITALREDPEIARDIAERNYLALLKNGRMLKACNDPKLAKLLKKFEVEKAIEFALQQTH